VITAIGKTPATAAGVLPHQRARALRALGTVVSAKMSTLVEGNILLMPRRAYVVLHTEYDLRRKGARLVLRDVEGAAIRTLPYEPDGWVTKLDLPAEITEGDGLWVIRPGDIVLYPGDGPEHAMAAIRHHHGWMRTVAPWSPLSDAEVVIHLQEGRLEVLRSSLRRRATSPRSIYPLGSVVASRNLQTPEPTVWLKTGDDYWVSSVRGVTASDVMINYELMRNTYHVVWAPKETGR
jgi:hypothetical protein